MTRSNPIFRARHFVLVHGANHGAWCWYKLVSLLEAAGHKVTALDLAASGRNQVPLDDLLTIDDFHQPLYSYLEALSPEDRVILVGHSLGGRAVSSAMERFPTKIALAVFVSADMIGPDLTINQIDEKVKSMGADSYGDSLVTTNGSSNDPPTSILLGPEYLSTKLYQNSPREDIALAILSIRVTKLFNDDKSNLELSVTKEKYGTVHRAYFIGGEEEAGSIDLQQWMIKNNPPDEVREIVGADHMVMISKPQELCCNLMEVAKKYY